MGLVSSSGGGALLTGSSTRTRAHGLWWKSKRCAREAALESCGGCSQVSRSKQRNRAAELSCRMVCCAWRSERSTHSCWPRVVGPSARRAVGKSSAYERLYSAGFGSAYFPDAEGGALPSCLAKGLLHGSGADRFQRLALLIKWLDCLMRVMPSIEATMQCISQATREERVMIADKL